MAKQVDISTLLNDHQQKYADRGTNINLGDGVVVHVPAPQLWPDDVFTLQRRGDLVGASMALVGADTYAAFVAAGGSASLLMSVIEDDIGVSVPE